VNANGTQGDVDLGDLQAKSVTVNAAGALGELTVSGATGETVSITGSELKANDITVTASKSGTVTGGIADDTINVTGTAAASGSATFTLTGGLGADTFQIAESGSGSADGKTVVTITDFSVAQGDVLKIGEPTTFAGDTDAEKAAAEFFNAAFGTTFAAEDVSIETVTVDTNTYSYYVIKGDAYIAVDNETVGTFDSGDLAIKLTGVTELEATSITTIS
jgi:hypothetical protein